MCVSPVLSLLTPLSPFFNSSPSALRPIPGLSFFSALSSWLPLPSSSPPLWLWLPFPDIQSRPHHPCSQGLSYWVCRAGSCWPGWRQGLQERVLGADPRSCPHVWRCLFQPAPSRICHYWQRWRCLSCCEALSVRCLACPELEAEEGTRCCLSSPFPGNCGQGLGQSSHRL